MPLTTEQRDLLIAKLNSANNAFVYNRLKTLVIDLYETGGGTVTPEQIEEAIADLPAGSIDAAQVADLAAALTKLSGIDSGATANDSNANLRDRTTHTGSQPASTISDFQSAVSSNSDVSAIKAIVGAGISDGDSVVNTLTEMLEAFQTYGEGVDIATQLSNKANSADLADVATSGDYNDLTGKPTIPTTFDGLTDGATNKAFTGTEKTKLSGIASGATANDTDANLRARSSHTGTQAISTVTGLQTALDAKATPADISSAVSAVAATIPTNLNQLTIADGSIEQSKVDRNSDGDYYIGANWSGMEYAWGTPPADADLDYVLSLNIKEVRISTAWERWQPTLNGALNTTYVDQIKDIIARLYERGIESTINIHNYGRYHPDYEPPEGDPPDYYDNGDPNTPDNDRYVLGDSNLPITYFADLWSRLATALKDVQGLVAYGLMNEPYDLVDPNLINNGNDFNGTLWWNVDNPTLTENYAANPVTGVNDAALLTTAGGYDGVARQVTLEAVPYTFAVWAKSVSGTKDFMLASDYALIGSVKTATTTWQKFYSTWTPTAGAHDLMIKHEGAGGGIIIYMAQLNKGATPLDISLSTWQKAAQAAVDAIRLVDTKMVIYVPGDNYGNVATWRDTNENLNVIDPYKNIIYEGHHYFNGNGIFTPTSYDDADLTPTSGIEQAEDWLNWLKERGFRGYIGELGIPSNDVRWVPLLGNTLDYYAQNNILVSYCSISRRQADKPSWTFNFNSNNIQINFEQADQSRAELLKEKAKIYQPVLIEDVSDLYRQLANKAERSEVTLLPKSKDPFMATLEALGSAIKGQSVGFDLAISNTATALADGNIKWIAVHLPVAATLTGVAFYQRVAGSFTADNENAIALYSYSNGTLTKVATTANAGSTWTGTANTFIQKAFSVAYAAQPGLYFVALIYNNSAQTTAPSLAGPTALNNAAMVAPLLSNSAKLYGVTTAQTALPTTQAMSAITANTAPLWFGLY